MTENQKKKAIIIDIDNTIFSQNGRKEYILRLVNNRHIKSKLPKKISVDSDYDLEKSLKRFTAPAKEDFWQSFFSENYYNDDNGNYTINIYDDCFTAIAELDKTFSIIYLTSRSKTPEQTKELKKQLSHFNLPKPNNKTCFLYMMDLKSEDGTLDTFNINNLEYKTEKIKKLKKKHEILAGIGDTYSDMDAYSNNGVTAIMFNSHYEILDTKSQHDLVFQHWGVIKSCIYILDDPKRLESEVIPFQELIENSTKEYTSYLRDLDAKTRLILAINTALFGLCAITLDKSDDIVLNIILFCAIIVFTISMIFCILAFSSKNIKLKKSGYNINYGIDINLWRAITGKKPMPIGSPIEKYEQLKASKHKKQKFADIQFFYNSYETLNLRILYTMRLYQARSLNYVKIYSEVWGRKFLYLGILIVIGALCRKECVKIDNGYETKSEVNQTIKVENNTVNETIILKADTKINENN